MRVETKGDIEYACTGAGPPVLLLHGAMGGWDQAMLLGQTAIDSGFTFIGVSRPGYLGTPLRAGPSPEQQADLCAGLLDSLTIRRAGVVAISGGGQCALQLALRHPKACAALVMISACNAPLAAAIPLRFRLMLLLARFPAMAEKMRKRADNNADAMAARAIPDPGLRHRTLNDPEVGPLFRANQSMMMARIAERLAGTKNDVRQSRVPFAYPVEQIQTPALIIHGTEDEAVPFAQAETLAAKLQRGELLALPGGRHVCLFTHYRAIRERVIRFLLLHLGGE